MSLIRSSMMHRKHWIIGALAAALWVSPAAAQAGSAADNVEDPSGRWPFSGRSRYDQLPPAQGSTNSADKNADYGGGRGETKVVEVAPTVRGAGQGGSRTDDTASTSDTTSEGTGSTGGDAAH